MTLITLPSDLNIKESSIRLRSFQQKFTSPLSGFTQIGATTSSKWEIDLTLAPLKNAQVGAIKAFLVKLKGMENTFKIYDPDRKLPLGSARTTAGTPKVNGANQVGTTLNVDGLPLSATGYLLEGDYIEFNNEFHMVVEQVNTNGSGQAAIKIEPPIKTSPADNADVIVTNAGCIVRLSEPKIEWSSDKNKIHYINFSGIEA